MKISRRSIVIGSASIALTNHSVPINAAEPDATAQGPLNGPKRKIGYFYINERIVETISLSRMENIIARASADGCTEILIALNTAGGEVEAGLAIFNLITSTRIPVTTYALSHVDSIGLFLLLSGSHRIVHPRAYIRMHNFKVEKRDIQQSDDELKKQIQNIVDEEEFIITSRTHIDKERYEYINRSFYFFNATEAVNAGIANEIKELKYPFGDVLYE